MIDRHTSTWSSWLLAIGLSLGVHALAFASAFVFEPESRAKPGTTTIDLVNVSFGSDIKAVEAATSLAPANNPEAVKSVKAGEKVMPTLSEVTEKVRPDTTKPKRQDPQRLEKAKAPTQSAKLAPVSEKAAQAPAAQLAKTQKTSAKAARAPDAVAAQQTSAAQTANRVAPAPKTASAPPAKSIVASPAPDKITKTVPIQPRVQAIETVTKPPAAATPEKPAQTIVVARAETKQPTPSSRVQTVRPKAASSPTRVKTAPTRVQTVSPKSVASPSRLQTASPRATASPRNSQKPIATRPQAVSKKTVKSTASAVRTEPPQTAVPKKVQSNESAARVSVAKPVNVARLSVPADRTDPSPVVKRPEPAVSAARVTASSVTAKPANAVPVAAAPASSAARAKPVTQEATTKVAAIGPVDPTSEVAAQASTGTGPRTVPLESLQMFESGECMLILPRTAGLMRTAFSAFGLRPYAAELFQREMERQHAVDLSISMSPLADAQCAVTEFVRSLPSYPLFSMRIELDRDVIKSGETLHGFLREASGQLSLILIDDEGFAHNVNQFLSLDGFDVVLSAPMHVTGQPVRTVQMFLAISAQQPLDTLADRSSRPAAAFFRKLSAELETKDIAIDVAVAAFRVE